MTENIVAGDSSKPLSGIRVAALVTNPCAPDARVMKQAESVAKAGAEVTIFCIEKEGVPNNETLNGVQYKRLKGFNSLQKSNFFNALKFIFSTFGEAPVKKILLSFALVFLLLLNICSKLFRFLKQVLKIKPNNNRESILYGKNSIFRPFLHAVYVFLRSDACQFVFFQDVVDFKPDIIHAHDFITVPAALSCAKKVGAKVIFDAHEIEADRVGTNDRLSVSIIEKNLKRYVPSIDAIISVNESAMNFYVYNYGLHYTPKAIIYNTPITEEAGKGRNLDVVNLRSQLNIQSNETLFVYTGGIGITRGVPEIVEAMKPVDNTHLCILGPQRDNILNPFVEHVKNLHMQERVHIVPPVPHHLVTATIQSADVGIMFIQPSCLNYLYCLPNKLFEITLSGLPFIVPDLPELRKFCEEEKVGLITPANDVEKLTDTIKEMAQDPLRFKPDGAKLDALKIKWAWPAQEEKLIPFYQKVLKNDNKNG